MSEKPGGPQPLTARFVLIVLILLAAAGPGFAQDAPAIDPNTQDMVSYLLGALISDRAVTAEHVVPKLVELGPRAVPCLVAAHAEFKEPEQVAVVLAALGRLDPTGVDRYLLAQTEGGGDDPARTDAYAKLAELGTANAIAPLIGQMSENHYSLKKSAELCLTRLLRKYDTAETYMKVGEAFRPLDDDTASRVACCMGDTASPHAVRLILTLFGRTGPLDHALVSAIAQLPGVLPANEVVPHLRGLLDSKQHGVPRETITALGMFQDTESVKTLVEILADAPERLRGNAHWALKNISGLDFPDDAVRWRLWHDGEVSWWESTGKALLEVLSSGDKGAILSALRALGRARLYRDIIRPEAEFLLDDADGDIRTAAAALLAELGFTKPADGGSISSAMASRGFTSIPRDQIPRDPIPETDAVRPPKSTSLVPIAGLAVLLALLARIFGPGLLERIKKLWGGEDKRDGPMTVKLKPKQYARRSRPKAGASEAKRPGK